MLPAKYTVHPRTRMVCCLVQGASRRHWHVAAAPRARQPHQPYARIPARGCHQHLCRAQVPHQSKLLQPSWQSAVHLSPNFMGHDRSHIRAFGHAGRRCTMWQHSTWRRRQQRQRRWFEQCCGCTGSARGAAPRGDSSMMNDPNSCRGAILVRRGGMKPY